MSEHRWISERPVKPGFYLVTYQGCNLAEDFTFDPLWIKIDEKKRWWIRETVGWKRFNLKKLAPDDLFCGPIQNPINH